MITEKTFGKPRRCPCNNSTEKLINTLRGIFEIRVWEEDADIANVLQFWSA